MVNYTLTERLEEVLGRKLPVSFKVEDFTKLCDKKAYARFIEQNRLPSTGIKHLIVTTEHADYRVTGGIGSYVKECDHLYGDDVGILIIDSNQDLDMEKIRENKWLAAQTFLSPERIQTIDAANFDTLGDLVLEVLQNLLCFYPNIESIEAQEMLLHRAIEAKKLGYIPSSISLITTCHGSSFHLAKARRDVLEAENIHVAYREKFTIEESDVTVFPTRFLRESYRDSGLINLDDESRIIKRLPFDYKRLPTGKDLEGYKRLIYIGKTSTIKGFDLFLGTLAKLHDDYPEICQQLDEVLIIATYTDIKEAYLRRMYEHVSHYFNMRVISLEREELLRNLSKYSEDSLALITYKGDNHPLAVLEFMAIGHDFLAARAGGTPELIPNEFAENYLVEPNESAFAEAVSSAFANIGFRSDQIKRLSIKYKKDQQNINRQYSVEFNRKLPMISKKKTTVYNKQQVIVNVIDTGKKMSLKQTLDSLKSQTFKAISIRVSKADELSKEEDYAGNFVLRLYAGDTIDPMAISDMAQLMELDSTTGAVVAYEMVPTYLGSEPKGTLEFHPFAPQLGSVFLQEKYNRRFVGLFRGEHYANDDFSDWQKCIKVSSKGFHVRVVPRLLFDLVELEGYVINDVLSNTSKMVHSFLALPVFDSYVLHSELKRFDDLYWGAKLTNHLEDIYVRRDDPSVMVGSSPLLNKIIHTYRARTPKIVRKGVSVSAKAGHKVLKRIKKNRRPKI